MRPVDGTIEKYTAETARFVVDLSGWLDDDEVIGSLTRFSLGVAEGIPLATAFQADFPFQPTQDDTPPDDDDPLILAGSQILGGTSAAIQVAAGTPGLTYIVSCLATGSLSGRRREIDFYVQVLESVNEAMVSSLDPTPSTSVTNVAASVQLDEGTTGTVFIDNATGAEIEITLPENPVVGQSITCVDKGQNAATYEITFVGDSGALINDQSEYVFAVDGQSATFEWDGAAWVVT